MARSEYPFLLGASVYTGVTFTVFNIIFNVQPTPYIDEVFHIPQAIQYCNGTFNKWDSKITTLPGLYLLSIGALNILSKIFGHPVCNLYSLRLTNVVASVVNFYLIYVISSQTQIKDKEYSRQKLLWASVNISIFPVLYFFSFVYYTDMVSTTTVLFMYQFHQTGHFWTAAVAGVLSIFVRQTNIVWIVFLIIDSFATVAKRAEKEKLAKMTPLKSLTQVIKVFKGLYSNLYSLGIQKSLRLFWLVHTCLAGYIIVCFMFLIFVFINKGIVVGDRLAHQPVLNLPQLFYYALFVTFFSLPHFVGKIKSFLKFVSRHWKFTVLSLVVFMCVVYANTLVHPYLLSDNRHFTFYLWKKVYERHASMRYLIVPVYLFGLHCSVDSLKHKSLLFQLAYWLCTFACLVPQKLLEFRYFITPFLLFRINIKNPTSLELLLESILYTAINIFTIYIFATKQFYWSDSTEIQRIMW